jgi:hypothetical protein
MYYHERSVKVIDGGIFDLSRRSALTQTGIPHMTPSGLSIDNRL